MAPLDDEALEAAPHHPVDVEQARVCEADPVGSEARRRVEADPLAADLAGEGHGEIRVDERVFLEIGSQTSGARGGDASDVAATPTSACLVKSASAVATPRPCVSVRGVPARKGMQTGVLESSAKT